ncbi:MAG TPA: DUF1501 domain-containing protein [Planctomycetaceae bacterium]|nr:DUF1501 domain-containing protein [Planctomycetaceae bacterium]
MPISRRRFLAASSFLACGAAVPGFWRSVALAAPDADQPGAADSILLVIELTGGNDGLNTVIPFRDEVYAAARPTLKQDAGRVLKINEGLAFHPGLGGFARLLERSQLAIVQGVGYPNPNRSHFSSMDIWHSASFSADEPFGWLGRGVEKMGAGVNGLSIGAGDSPRALTGPSARALRLQSLADYDLKVSRGGDEGARRRVVEEFAAGDSKKGDLADLVKQAARETYRSAARLRQVATKYETPVKYPATGLAERLKLVAQLIAAGVPERIYYTTLPGFDTHSNQARQHDELLGELAGAVASFHEDIAHHGQQKRVLTVTFSEFGRRVKENASLGTDHGAASQMFVAGEAVRAGALGEHPSLTDLDDGDLKFHTDFRSVYAAILDQWLKIPSQEVLGNKFAPIELFKKEAAG